MGVVSTNVGPGQLVTSFVSWMATLPANVGTSGNTYVCNVIGKLTDYNQTLAGHSCTATNYITITAPAGQSFADNAGRLAYNAAAGSAWESRNDHSSMLTISDSYTVLSRLQFYSTGNTMRAVFVNAMNCWVDRCIIESQQRNGLGVLLLYGPGGCNHLVSNTLCVSRTGGANGIEITSVSTAINCTVVRPADIGAGSSGQGINLNYGTNTIRNCAIFGFFDNAITPTPNADGHNVTDIANCPGTTGNITGATYANQFENNTDYGADFRLKPGSDCINAGVTDTTNLPSGADIFGISRPYGASWDVGANEWKKAPLVAQIGTGGAAAGRDYSSISAWIASLPANLVADGNSYRGECYNDGEFNDGRMTIGGHTTDATHTITLTTAAGQSFRDHANKLTNRISYNQAVGVGIQSDNGHATLFACLDNYITISNLQVWTHGTTAGVVQLNGTNSIVENMIIQGTVRDNRYAFVAVGDGNSTSVVRNTIVISMRDYAFGLGAAIGFASGSFANFVNCTAVKTLENTYAATGANGNGFQTGYQPSLVRNCMSFGFIGNYSQLTPPPDGHNSTDVSFIHGTIGNKVNQVYADQFVNPSQLPPETMDFRLKNTSGSINAGVDASSVTLQGSNVVTMTTDGLGTTRPVNATWDIGFEESFLTGVIIPPPDFFDLYADATYKPPQRYPQYIRRVVVPPYQPPPPPPAIKTFYATNIAAVSPGWWSLLQEGGTAPTAAASSSGYNIQKVTTTLGPFWRSRLGVSGAGQLSATSGTTSYIAAPVAGPIVGTGNTSSTAGDSFRSPAAYTGTFPSGNWTIALGFRTGATTVAGAIRCRIWASTSATGVSPRELTTALLTGSTVTMNSTSATFTSSITWAAPAITLTNEYLYFQIEWNSTTNSGNSNSSNATIWVGSGSSIVTTLFSPPGVPVTGRLIRSANPDTISATGDAGGVGNVIGNLIANQDPQTINASGTLGLAPVTGTLTANQAVQTLGANGVIGPAAITGTLTANQAVQTINANGALTDVGGLTANQAVQTLGANGALTDIANLTANQTVQTLNAGGTVGGGLAPVAGNLAVNQAVQTIDASGTVSGGLSAVTGTLTANQAVQTLVAWATSPNALLTLFVNTGGATGLNGEAGLKFKSSANTDYNRIGLRAKAGVTGLHTVKLYNYDTLAVLQTGSVDLTGSTVGNFYYVPMPTTTLVSGTNYALTAALIASEQFPSNCPVTLRNAVAGQTSSAFYDTSWHILAPDVCYYGVDLDYVSTGVSGALNGSQDAQTINASGTVSGGLPTVTGTLTANQAVQTINAAGTPTAGANLTANQAVQTINANGASTIGGNLTANQAVQTLGANGTPTDNANLSANQAVQTINAGGGPKPNAALTANQAVQTINASGGPQPNATLTALQVVQTLNSAGSVVTGISATLVANQAVQTINATGTLTPITAGTLNAFQAVQTINTVGTPVAGGNLTANQAVQTINATGGTAPNANLTANQAVQTINANGTTPDNATLTANQAVQTLGANGASTVRGTLTANQAVQTINATGSVLFGVGGGLTASQAVQTINATGTVAQPVIGILTANQAVQTLNASGTPTARGTLTANQAVQTFNAAGTPVAGGNLTALQAVQTINAHGTMGAITGSLIVFQGVQTLASNGGPTARGTLTASQMPNLFYGIGRVGAEQTRVILMA
jgi:hypothetical protein